MHNDTWQLQEAKAKFSAVVRQSLQSPQCVTYRGIEAAYIISPDIMHEYEILRKKRQSPKSNKQTKAKAKKQPKTLLEALMPLRKFTLGEGEVERLFKRVRSKRTRSRNEALFD